MCLLPRRLYVIGLHSDVTAASLDAWIKPQSV